MYQLLCVYGVFMDNKLYIVHKYLSIAVYVRGVFGYGKLCKRLVQPLQVDLDSWGKSCAPILQTDVDICKTKVEILYHVKVPIRRCALSFA